MKRRKPIAYWISACRRKTCRRRAGRMAQRGGGGAVAAPMRRRGGGRSRHPARRRRIEAETAPPPPRTAVSRHAPSRPSLPRRPAGAAEQLRLPAIAVAQPFLHPAAGPGGRLALGEQARELGPVLDLLEQDDLVVAARAGRDGPARRDRDHARAARLR